MVYLLILRSSFPLTRRIFIICSATCAKWMLDCRNFFCPLGMLHCYGQAALALNYKDCHTGIRPRAPSKQMLQSKMLCSLSSWQMTFAEYMELQKTQFRAFPMEFKTKVLVFHWRINRRTQEFLSILPQNHVINDAWVRSTFSCC